MTTILKIIALFLKPKLKFQHIFFVFHGSFSACENKIDDIYNLVQDCYDLYDQYDYNGEPDGTWDNDKEEEISQQRRKKENELISKILSQYTNYQPKAAVTFGIIQTLAIVSVNYYGNHIKCTNFYPIGSTFSNFNSLAKDFSAQVTITDSVTYKLISELEITDLVLFPVSLNPYNIYAIEQIDFTESQWKLKMRGHLDDPGLVISNSVEYTIDTAKIRGSLFLVSAPTKCDFNVPDTKADQVLKSLSIDFDFYNSINVKEIPGIALLENHNEKRKRSTLLEDTGVSFKGNWDKVKKIEGTLGIDTGSKPANIDVMPEVVVQVIDVKSEGSQNYKTDAKDIKFSQPQIISQEKAMSFNSKDTKVTFSNLTFTGENPQLSLQVGGQQEKIITDNILIDSDSKVKIIGNLEVKSSFEIGPDSSIEADSITSTNPDIKINYRLASEIGEIPEGIIPKSFTFNYIGETDLDFVYPDTGVMEIKVMTFPENENFETCRNLAELAKFDSPLYSEFRGENPAVSAQCATIEDANKVETRYLYLRVNRKVNLDADLPSDNVVDLPSYKPAEDIEVEDDGDDDDNSNKKNKLGAGPIAGIVIGVIAFVAIVAVLVWYFVFHKKKDAGTQSSVGENVDENA